MKITVATVCFNSAAHIARALRSIDIQDWPDFEHVIVDGASRDHTLDIIAGHARPWRRVVSEPDNGIYDAMNKAIGLATGDVVGTLNSDDAYADRTVLSQVAQVFSDPAVEACYADLLYVLPTEGFRPHRFLRSRPYQRGLFALGWCPPHPTFFVRRSVYERHGAFDLRYKLASDAALMMRFLEVVGIKSVYVPRTWIHMSSGGATNASWRNVLQQNREILHAATELRIKMPLIPFVYHKVFDRLRQRVRAGAAAHAGAQ